VAIVHSPYDRESQTYPERPDTYSFEALEAAMSGVTVGEFVTSWCSPQMPDGRKVRVMPHYTPGEDFGIFVRLWPAYEGYPAPGGYEVGIISEWTRLDAASMSSLGVWRDRTVARREAWEALRPYVEGGDVPVPRSV
jgi:hypothetical protein